MTRVVFAVGNAYRRDDGVGLAVGAALAGRVAPDVVVVPCEQEPSRLIDAWNGAATAVVVDAMVSGARPGTVHRFDASTDAIPAGVFRSSTHAFGVGDAVELARALGRLPARVLVYGVEGEAFDAGEGLTRSVQDAVPNVVAAVLDDLTETT